MMNNSISTIGVIGYGRFGSFFTNNVLPQIFPQVQIRIASRSHVDKRVVPFKEVAASDLIFPAVPIRAMPGVLQRIAKHVRPHSIVMDICSVNVFPAKWMREYLPKTTPLISSHPMFGASSYEKVNHDLSKLTIVMYPVRIDTDRYEQIRNAFCRIFKVVEMSPDTHDQKAAHFQFLSHLLGSVLHRLDLKRTAIDTESASRMFDMIEVLNNDSMELFEDMYKYNPYAQEVFSQFSKMYTSVTNHLSS